MEEDEYKIELNRLSTKHRKEKSEVHIKFALANNTVKKGDLITDHIGTILVKYIKVGFPYFSKIPECIFCGPGYTKKGKPFKNDQEREVWQSNLIKNYKK